MKAILFDLDGTLIDSQDIINNYVKKILKNKNIKLEPEEKQFLKGMSIKDFVKWLNKNKQTKITSKDITITNELIETIPLFKGVIKTLKLIKTKNVKTAIVTNSPRKYLDKIMNDRKIINYFDTTISETESKVAKPNPLMLKMACEQLNVKPNECIIIDDNEAGITAGNILGMISIRIGKEKEKNKANYIIENISQLPKILEKITLQ